MVGFEKEIIADSWSNDSWDNLSVAIGESGCSRTVVLNCYKRYINISNDCKDRRSIILSMMGNIVSFYSPEKLRILLVNCGNEVSSYAANIMMLPQYFEYSEPQAMEEILSSILTFDQNEDKINLVVVSGLQRSDGRSQAILRNYINNLSLTSRVYFLIDGLFVCKDVTGGIKINNGACDTIDIIPPEGKTVSVKNVSCITNDDWADFMARIKEVSESI